MKREKKPQQQQVRKPAARIITNPYENEEDFWSSNEPTLPEPVTTAPATATAAAAATTETKATKTKSSVATKKAPAVVGVTVAPALNPWKVEEPSIAESEAVVTEYPALGAKQKKAKKMPKKSAVATTTTTTASSEEEEVDDEHTASHKRHSDSQFELIFESPLEKRAKLEGADEEEEDDEHTAEQQQDIVDSVLEDSETEQQTAESS